MEWIDLIDVEKVCWSLASQAFGFWLCWTMQAKPAKQELEQLKRAAKTKVVSIRNHLKESEELLDRLSKDYPHLMNDQARQRWIPNGDGIPKPFNHPRGWRHV